ncbi:ATP-binding protein [Nocardiopsis lambiniae]|uniref:ATP-binding protein n=1 Tax=Nocardiopsis lambiniae TaxID=3075539 RepID=A0ABU2MC84_9ACTN|nr:ATP-binding protein [Nocardiopsis sp. DSM 44743]MDT0329541.1 ATP-binding protein [Nocardiopsis sp. DSM 44743]
MQATTPAPALPRRIPFPDAATTGLLCGSDPRHVAVARRWIERSSQSGPSVSSALVSALSELHTNCLRHTLSGKPGGTVRIVLERQEFVHILYVTDNGPDTSAPFGVPLALPPAPDGELPAVGGHGLRLLESLSLYWDWTGEAGGPLTVRAVFSRAADHRIRRPR